MKVRVAILSNCANVGIVNSGRTREVFVIDAKICRPISLRLLRPGMKLAVCDEP